MGSAASSMQEWIAAREKLEAIEYGIRSLELLDGRQRFWTSPAKRAEAGQSACHDRQILAACAAAGIARDRRSLWLLKGARKAQREQVKAAAAAIKSIGGQRQLRLALAA